MNTEQMLTINRSGWDQLAGHFRGTALPRYGPLAQSETELHLIEPVTGARILDIGCGAGESLLYLAQQGAGEAWGLDLSPAQLKVAAGHFQERSFQVHLFQSPMEENPGLPLSYFDFVISIYALGWTADLSRTLGHVVSYLKPNGCFIFSWEHPVYSCLEYEAGRYVFSRSYHREGSEFNTSWKGVPVVMQHRKLDTYLNGLIRAEFVVERVVESELDATVMHDHNCAPEYWYSQPRAESMPTTLIIKARKRK